MGDVFSVRLDEQLNEIIENYLKEQKVEKSEAIR